MLTRRIAGGLAALAAVGAITTAQAQTEISFYYPVAVGGPITKIIDGLAADFEKENAGIKVKPKLVEVTVLTDTLMKGQHQALISSNLTGPDSLATLQCFYSKTPRTACRYTNYSSPAFDKLFEDASASLDPAKRTDLLRQANNLLYEDAPVWFFNYNKAVLAYQPWIHGLQANPTEITHQYPEDIWVGANSPAK